MSVTPQNGRMMFKFSHFVYFKLNNLPSSKGLLCILYYSFDFGIYIIVLYLWLVTDKYSSSKTMIEQFNCVEVASYRNHESLSESSVEIYLEKAHAVGSDGSEPEIDSGRGLMAEKGTLSQKCRRI
mgnify:CR=1 FL=1